MFVKRKYKNRMFAIVPTEQSVFQTYGVSLLVIHEDDEKVSGLKFKTDGNENFSCTIEAFALLIKDGFIEEMTPADLIEGSEDAVLPKYIMTPFKKQYAKNLK